MQISHRHKFIFFSFPKTGSESVRQLLEPYADVEVVPFWERSEEHPFYSHISPAEVKQLFAGYGWDYDAYYKFTFVRNPWARMVSLYNMIYCTRPVGMLGKVRRLLLRQQPPSFADWLETTQTSGIGAGGPEDQRWRMYGSWSIASYILDEDGNDLVDEVIRLEDINDKVPALLERLGLTADDRQSVPYINKRTASNYSDYFDEDSRSLIARRYNYDIERFGYSFEDLG